MPLGVLFSLDESEVEKLKSFETDEERLVYLQEEIEENYFEDYPQRVAELDKAWDALHRSLTDGKLEYTNGTFPLSHVILGGESVYNEDDYVMVLKTPAEVISIAKAVEKADDDFLRKGYNQIDPEDYGLRLTEEDLDYTCTWFNDSKEFWKLAASEGRYVLFTVDQ